MIPILYGLLLKSNQFISKVIPYNSYNGGIVASTIASQHEGFVFESGCFSVWRMHVLLQAHQFPSTAHADEGNWWL